MCHPYYCVTLYDRLHLCAYDTLCPSLLPRLPAAAPPAAKFTAIINVPIHYYCLLPLLLLCLFLPP